MKVKNGMLLNMSEEVAPILVDADDEMEVIIECPNCGQATKFGNVRMVSGYSGCNNHYKGGSCYFDDLLPRVTDAKSRCGEPIFQDYIDGKLYSKERETK